MSDVRAGYQDVPGGLRFGGSDKTILTDVKLYTPTIDVASVAANTTAEQTFTVTGLRTDDVVLCVIKPTLSAGLGICGWRVSATDTLAITFNNNTAAPIDPAAQVYKVLVVGINLQ